MKKLLSILLLTLVLVLSACSTKNDKFLTSLSITGPKDLYLMTGNSHNLLNGVKALGSNNKSYLDDLEISSDNCSLQGNIISSSQEVDCVIDYHLSINDISVSKSIVISFREEISLEKIEAFNSLRIYQIYVSAYKSGQDIGYTYGYGPSNHNGDLQGIINSLDYIKSLGMNAIWLTPIFESKEFPTTSEFEIRGRSTGYFADDYFNIDPNFGTNELFKTLVDEAHSLGLYVFLDGVFGHHGYHSIEGVVDGRKQWYGYETIYPESLDFFIEVATYWIDEYGIDGWRMDQAYQLFQNNYNYFREIRKAIEDISNERKARGEEWGTLGYVVAEIWDNQNNIQKYAYDQSAFRSAFDFPVRLQLVRALAVDEYNNSSSLRNLANAMNYSYSDFAQQNLFITNHDTIRFGDLLQIAGLEHEYYQRHKLALSFLAQYTGPITVYYGDEYGDQFDGLSTNTSELNQYPYIAIDNVARTNGRVDDFTEEQTDLINYLRFLMNLRENNEALFNGSRENLYVDDNLYVDLKTTENNQVLFIMNISNSVEYVTIDTSKFNGNELINLFDDSVLYIEGDTITLEIDSLTSIFFLVN